MKIETSFKTLKLLLIALTFSFTMISCDEGEDEFDDIQLDNQPQQTQAGQQQKPQAGPQGIMHEQGYCYLLPVPQHVDKSDDMQNPNRSTLVLLENGKPLGPGHSSHADVRQKGQGRYSHWQQFVFFSASDNSDPMTNGRKYTVEIK